MKKKSLTIRDMEKLRVGMKAFVDFKVGTDRFHENGILSLTTVVEEVSSDFHLLIQMPVHNRMFYPMIKNHVYPIRIMSEGTIYSVYARFVEKVKRDKLMYAKVLLEGPMKSGQMREYYRLPCSFDIACMKLSISEESLNEEEFTEEPIKFMGRTINISGGGMLLVTNEKVKKSEHIMMTIDIGTEENLVGRVVRVEQGEEVSYTNRIAIKFIGINNEQQNRLSKFIVEEQLNKRRKLTDKIPLNTRRDRMVIA